MDLLFLQIGILFFLALVGGLISIKIRQSTMVGYLLIGLILSPSISFTIFGFHYNGFMVNNYVISTFSQLGLVMILFFIGLNVDPQRFRKKGEVSIILAIFDLSILFIFGYLIGIAFKWDIFDSIFLGFIVSASSVVVSAKSMDDLRKLSTDASDALISMLVIEDILSIVLITIFLGTLVTKEFWPKLINVEFLGISAFLAFIIFLSMIFLPTIKRKFFSRKNEEVFILFILSITFLISSLLDIFNISPAIGAFFGGMLFSQSDIVKDIEPKLISFKYAFGAIFFVTYGIGVNFSVFLNYALLILILVIIIILGELLIIGSITYLLGFSSKESLFIGSGLIPRSEDSLIFANLANSVSSVSKNLLPLSSTLFSLTGAIVIITSIITPLFLRLSSRMSRLFLKIIPKSIIISSSLISKTMRAIFFTKNVPIIRKNPILGVFSIVLPFILILNFFILNIFYLIFSLLFLIIYFYFINKYIYGIVKTISFAFTNTNSKKIIYHVNFLIFSFFIMVYVESIISKFNIFWVLFPLLIFVVLVIGEFIFFSRKRIENNFIIKQF
ncbi:MAG: cation:proton antiporter [Thermoplasmata archaeon]